jgi:hypothetical protein
MSIKILEEFVPYDDPGNVQKWCIDNGDNEFQDVGCQDYLDKHTSLNLSIKSNESENNSIRKLTDPGGRIVPEPKILT